MLNSSESIYEKKWTEINKYKMENELEKNIVVNVNYGDAYWVLAIKLAVLILRLTEL